MSNRADRIKIIDAIEKKRGSKLLCYLTSDRRNLEARIAKDVYPYISEHLLKFNKVPKIDLLLHTNGGDTLAGFGLVKKIREFCTDSFSVLVPFKALSCGTLICLGADSVIMTKMGMLSPIDPSVTSEYNPQAPQNYPQAGVFLPVSVEDVAAFLKLAREEGKINDLEQVFLKLSEKVHPLALGKVFRTREQIVMLGKELLSTRKNGMDSNEKERIVNYLSRELGSHDYEISLTEAKEKLKNVSEPPDDIMKDMWMLYDQYRKLMELDSEFNPDIILGSDTSKTYETTSAVIESKDVYHRFKHKIEMKRVRQQVAPGVFSEVMQHRIIEAGWVREEN